MQGISIGQNTVNKNNAVNGIGDQRKVGKQKLKK